MISKKDADAIIEKNYLRIYKLTLALLHDSFAAEETTHEVFVFFLENIGSLEDTNIAAWLNKVVQNKVHEKIRQSNSDKKKLVSLESNDIRGSYNDDFYDPDYYKNYSDDDILAEKNKIINSLSKEEQELFMYIYSQNMKFSTVAKLLNITEKAVGVRAVRLRKKIKSIAKKSFILFIVVAIKTKLF